MLDVPQPQHQRADQVAGEDAAGIRAQLRRRRRVTAAIFRRKPQHHGDLGHDGFEGVEVVADAGHVLAVVGKIDHAADGELRLGEDFSDLPQQVVRIGEAAVVRVDALAQLARKEFAALDAGQPRPVFGRAVAVAPVAAAQVQEDRVALAVFGALQRPAQQRQNLFVLMAVFAVEQRQVFDELLFSGVARQRADQIVVRADLLLVAEPVRLDAGAGKDLKQRKGFHDAGEHERAVAMVEMQQHARVVIAELAQRQRHGRFGVNHAGISALQHDQRFLDRRVAGTEPGRGGAPVAPALHVPGAGRLADDDHADFAASRSGDLQVFDAALRVGTGFFQTVERRLILTIAFLKVKKKIAVTGRLRAAGQGQRHAKAERRGSAPQAFHGTTAPDQRAQHRRQLHEQPQTGRRRQQTELIQQKRSRFDKICAENGHQRVGTQPPPIAYDIDEIDDVLRDASRQQRRQQRSEQALRARESLRKHTRQQRPAGRKKAQAGIFVQPAGRAAEKGRRKLEKQKERVDLRAGAAAPVQDRRPQRPTAGKLDKQLRRPQTFRHHEGQEIRRNPGAVQRPGQKQRHQRRQQRALKERGHRAVAAKISKQRNSPLLSFPKSAEISPIPETHN